MHEGVFIYSTHNQYAMSIKQDMLTLGVVYHLMNLDQ